jgi:cell division protein YceG involved in septum cleavage
MTTVVNNPTPQERTVVQADSGGWSVAVIVLILVIAGGLFWYFYYHRPAQAPQPRAEGTTINVSLPAGSGSSTVGNP